MTRRHLLFTAWVGCWMVLLAVTPAAALPEHQYRFTKPGFDPGNMRLSGNDAVSTYGGALQMCYSDLALPGKGGLDLAITRCFNQKYRPLESNRPEYSPVADSVLGAGWTLHVAPELLFDNVANVIRLHMPDGGLTDLLPHPTMANIYVGPNLWKAKVVPQTFNQPTKIFVYTPTGRMYYYDTTRMRIEETYYTPTFSSIQYLMVPQTIQDLAGNTVTIEYDDVYAEAQLTPWPENKARQGRIRRIVDTYGRELLFTYNPSDIGAYRGALGTLYPPRLQRITGAGHTLTYTASYWGQFPHTNYLETFHDGDFTTRYAYYTDAARNRMLATITLPTGATTTYDWVQATYLTPFTAAIATQNMLKKIVAHDGRQEVTSYQYITLADESKKTLVTDPAGYVTEYYHQSYPDPTPSATLPGRLDRVKRFDDKGQLLTETVETHKLLNVGPQQTDMLFPNEALQRRTIETEQSYRSGQLMRQTTRSNFDAYMNAQTVAESGAGNVSRATALTYHTIDDLANNRYYVHGLVTTRTLDGVLREAAVFNALGQATQHTVHDDMFGNRVTTFAYWGAESGCTYAGNPCPGHLKTVTNAPGANQRQLHFNRYKWGVAYDVTDDVGALANLDVREDGRVITSTDRNGHSTSYQYTASGLLKFVDHPLGDDQTIDYSQVTDAPPVVTAWRGTDWTQYTFDQLLRVTAAKNGVGVQSCTTYDKLGRVWKTTLPAMGGCSGRYTETLYDALSRPTQRQLLADGIVQTTTYAYPSPTITQVTDPKHRVTTSTVDGFGRLTQLQDTGSYTTSYGYNALDQLTRVTQGTLTRTLTYSSSGALASEQHPESGTTTYDYNVLGELESRSQGLGAISFTYDKRGRQQTIDYPDRADTTFAYDGAPCLANCKDRLAQMTDETGATDFLEYDANGNLKRKHVAITQPALAYDTAYTYDTLDRLQTITYPSGRVLTYGYDNANRLTSLQQTLGATASLIRNIVYTPASTPDVITYGNNVQADWQWDSKFRPQRMDLTNASKPFSLGYDEPAAYDAVDNVMKMRVNGQLESFDYDALDRLTSADLSGAGQLTDQYDQYGNRYGRTSTVPGIAAHTFAVNNNRLTGNGFEYDANGNVTKDGRHVYSFTADNKLRAIDGDQVTYYYNGNGERVKTVRQDGTVELTAYELGQPATRWRVEP